VILRLITERCAIRREGGFSVRSESVSDEPKKSIFRASRPLIALAIAAGMLLSFGGPTSAQFFNFGAFQHRPHHPHRSGGWFGRFWFGTFGPFHHRAFQPRWERRRLATPVRGDFHRVHQAQRKNGSLKLHDVMAKMLPDRQPVQPFGARTSLDPRPRGNDDATAGEPLVNRAADEIQVAPPPVMERKAEPIIGTARVDRSADIVQLTPQPVVAEPIIGTPQVDHWADVVQLTPQPVFEPKAEPRASLNDALTLVMMMVVALTLGLIEFLFRRTYAKRVLAFAAMRRSQRRPGYARPANLSWRPRDQIEADPTAASRLWLRHGGSARSQGSSDRVGARDVD
jgi:hypothetical protein